MTRGLLICTAPGLLLLCVALLVVAEDTKESPPPMTRLPRPPAELEPPVPAAPTAAQLAEADVAELVEGNNQFALDLHRRLSAKNESNFIVSPFSISTALAVVHAGARGETAAEMAKTLRFTLPGERLPKAYKELLADMNGREGEPKRPGELSVANALWCQKDFPFRTDFLSLVKDQYQADLSLLDFIKDPEGGRKEINRWVEDKTRRKIRELIQPGQVEPHTKFVVTNAIYLNKSWETRFPKKLTREESFDTGKGEKQVWMMRGHLAKPYHKAEGVQLLQLPYEDGRLAMLIVLPDAGQDLKKFEQDLTWPKLSKWIANLKRSGVDVSLPRVQAVESRNHLAQILIAMGMRRSFTSQADFSGMISDKEIQLKDVIHQALLSVDENETEAAGATAIVGIELVSSPSQSLPTFRADRPFLIFLRDTHSGAILFTGRVTNP